MATVHIIVGSVYGNAQHVGEEAESYLAEQGVDCTLFTDPEVSDFVDADALLVISSTTGQGDVPPNLELVIDELRTQFPLLNQKPFAVAALGDSSYGDSFCGAGKQIFELLNELQGKAVSELLEVDALETFEPEKDVVEWVKGIQASLTA